jgi:ATP-dependent RNA helicase DDX5/DBP2
LYYFARYGHQNGMGGGGGFNRGGFQQNRGGFQSKPPKVDYNLRETTLKPINFDSAPPFHKDFYNPSELNRNRSQGEIDALKAKYEITLKGRDADTCKPIALFNEAGFPDFIMSEISNQGFVEPTSIQAVTIPSLMSGRNIVGIAKTGSGKTLAYILPSLIHCKNQPPIRSGDGPIVLVLAPVSLAIAILKQFSHFFLTQQTRELAQQIQVVANDFGSRNNISNV